MAKGKSKAKPGKAAGSRRIRTAPVEDATRAFERALAEAPKNEHYVLRLYITGSTARSAAAISNIRRLCDEYLSGNYDLEVVDIYQQPTLAKDEQIIAAPTLIKKFPFPLRKVVGDLSNEDRVLMGLDLRPKKKADR